jgi:peptidoglycan/LPS O-acetylase OafA/YrhL
VSLAELPSATNEGTAHAAHRIGGVDVLRGLSILAVIVLHVEIRVPFDHTSLGEHLSATALHVIFHSGYYGVMVFFVISGFLITSLSFRRWGALSKINLREFYTLRFARIAPCLIALLAISSALHIGKVPGFAIDPHRTSLGKMLWSAITLHVNWLEVPTREHLPGNWDVLWSLSIEEVFYLGFPLICKTLKKEWALYSFMLAFVAIGPFARVLDSNPIWAEHSYFSCFDGIAIGFFAAVIANKIRIKDKTALGLWIFGCCAAIFAVVFKSEVRALGLYRTGLDVTMLEVATACIILGLRRRKMPGASWIAAPIRWFGRNSYEVYLTHCFLVIPAALAFRALRAPINSAPIWYVAVVCLSGVLGWFVARFYSEPINRGLRQRLIFAPRAALLEREAESDVNAAPA